MPRALVLLFAFLGWGCFALSADAPGTKKVLIIGIDGCRSDALKAAKAPHLHGLMRDGAFAENTQILPERDTKADTVSGPGWSAILTGAWADKHGVIDNGFKGANYQDYPHFFRRLKDARPSAFTASVVTWPPIHERIVTAADASFSFYGKEKNYREYDAQAAQKACELLKEKDPDALFVYLGNVDETGHAKGFHPQVPEYARAIEEVDAHVGAILKALRDRPRFAREDWLVLVCTDHGGQGTDHAKGHKVFEIRTVFLIVSGPSIRPGKIEGPTSLVDVPVTALTHLGVPVDPKWKLDGRAVGLRK
jgi:predicted AlkP superfamily pyrophosphatase or phosphodiesterase